MKKLAVFLLAALLTSATLAQSGSSSSQPAPGLMPRGTAALPGMYFAGDRDTGIYWDSANRIGFTEGGVARAVVVDVLWYGATGDGVADDTAAFNAALSSLPASGGTVNANVNGKTWKWASAITVPSKVTLDLGPGVHVAAGVNGIEVTVGSTGASGRVVGHGSQTRINHTGTGYAINAFTGNGGQASALVEVADLVINGTGAGAGGVRLKAFNGATLRNVEVYGYSAGSGYFIEGANAVTIFNPNNYSNLYGIRTVGVVVNSVNYSPNAIKVFGGQLRDNPGWGFFDDGSQAATVGASIGNLCSGVVFESNGVNASGVTGHIFLQGASNFKIIGNYFEYGGALIPLNGIVIGDATHGIKGTYIVGNSFLSSTATSTISNVNGEKTHVAGNQEDGAVTNFINNGTASRAIYVGRNSASAAGTYFAGADDGVDSYIFDGGGTQPNAVGTTTVGFGFNVVSGLRQDLRIRARSGGGNTLLFEDSSGNNIGSLGLTGKLNVADKIFPGTDAAAAQSVAGFYAGNGLPNNANGSNGDFYFRGDGTVAGKTSLYHKEGGAWVDLSAFATLAGSETLTSKTLTTPIVTLEQGAAPSQTAEGRIQWDTDDDRLVVGTGVATKTFRPYLTATATYDPASLSAGNARCDDVTVTGITTTGGAVSANIGAVDPAAGCVVATVRASAADTVRICWRNAIDTITACDTASSTWTFSQSQ